MKKAHKSGEVGCRWKRMDKGVILVRKSVGGLLGNLHAELTVFLASQTNCDYYLFETVKNIEQ